MELAEPPLDGASSPRTATGTRRGHPCPAARGWLRPAPLRALLPHQRAKALVHTGTVRKTGRVSPCQFLQHRGSVLQGSAGLGSAILPVTFPPASSHPLPRALGPVQAPKHLARSERMLRHPSS